MSESSVLEQEQLPAAQTAALPMPVVNASDLTSRVQVIQRAVDEVMIEKTHYGVIPGTKKPTLLKPGTEVLLAMFSLSVEPRVEDLSTDEEVRYRVTAIARHQQTDTVVGYGIGECNTQEEKYAWRAALVQEEYDETPANRRRIKWEKEWENRRPTGKHKKVLQVRTNPFDKANTILKMAKKRAQVDLCLTTLACSDIFEQDLEEFDPETGESSVTRAKPATRSPQKKAGAGASVNKTQLGILQNQLDSKEISAMELCKHLEIANLTELSFDRFNEASAWINQQ